MDHRESPPPGPTEADRRLLERCAQMALGSLSGALHAMLEKATDDLFRLADKAIEHAMTQLYLEAMTLARDRAQDIERAFRMHLEQALRAAILFPRSPAQKKQRLEPALDQLALVDPDDLEESIASQQMTAKMRSDCTEELAGLEKRMGALFHDPELARWRNPFDPAVLAEAFMAACRDTEAPLKVRLLLVTMWDEHMADAVLATYREINRYLIEKGILPRIRHEIRRAAAASTAEIATVAARAAVEAMGAAQATSPPADLLGLMQQWLQAGGFPPAAATPNPALGGITGAAGNGRNPVVLTQLTALQHAAGEGATFSPAQAGGAMPVTVLRDLRETVLADKLDQTDALTLEVVAMLFDFIFQDTHVPDPIKALLGRLQIPVLKAAMLDPAFFSKRTHPTRRFVNAVAEAATGSSGPIDRDSPLYQKVHALVQRILDEFEDDLSLFETALAEFEAFLAEQERAADALVAAATPLIVAREQQELARDAAEEAAHEAVRVRASDPELPETVRAMLCQQWFEVLVHAHLGGGEEGEPWREAIAAMDDLVWSVKPKTRREERERLIHLLPGLLRRLKEALAAIQVDPTTCERFFGELVKCHAAAVSAGFSQPAPAAENTPPKASTGAVILPFPRRETEPVRMNILKPGEEGGVEMEEITIQPVGWVDAEEERSTGGGSPLTTPSAGEDQLAPGMDEEAARATVAALKPGAWVEFRHHGMEPLAARLKWISPLKGTYLFADRQGKRGATMPREKLEAAFRIGSARLLDEAPLLDRAVDNVLAVLKTRVA